MLGCAKVSGSIRPVKKREQDGSPLCFRDNCFAFDPMKYVDLHKADDPFAHMGLRMVMGGVKEADYTNPPGHNNLKLAVWRGEQKIFRKKRIA